MYLTITLCEFSRGFFSMLMWKSVCVCECDNVGAVLWICDGGWFGWKVQCQWYPLTSLLWKEKG